MSCFVIVIIQVIVRLYSVLRGACGAVLFVPCVCGCWVEEAGDAVMKSSALFVVVEYTLEII